MNSALTIDRWQFAFTNTFHYLFPQLTMGLALLIVVLKTIGLRRADEHYNKAARFWAKIFAVNFAMGVVTGIPMEFQFGTNWSRFSATAGGVIGHTLAMEGVFSFFLESTFLGLFLFGEKRLGVRGHWFAAFMVFAGSWLSGFLIVATNAWMQHPVAFERAADGSMSLASFWGLLGNPWLGWQYAHTMLGAVLTGCFAMASIGAYYLLHGSHAEFGRTFVRIAVIVGLPAALLAAFPTGDGQAKMVAQHQPVTFAAMEGAFQTEHGASLVLVGQPDMEQRRLDNPIAIPRVLSFLTHNRWTAEVKGLEEFPETEWPDNVPLLYFAYHVMAGLGTLFIAVMGVAAWLLWRGRLFRSRWMLWVLLLLLPFPYIANTAGWMTAEMGRQPWVIHGLMRTSEASSPNVSTGNGLFTLIGFMGMYALLGILFLFLVIRDIDRGPEPASD
ncbi:MAG: cytochrome ubiquinol oxidase subunit I [Planctomycetes bacterium]|nr:cytochrome ubiquinol oxidase subunit I [Planctomycetota bacterium]MBI3845575.1 cytochrome ubiquinol oxidase subunit I [Planctomycetota bacterium]